MTSKLLILLLLTISLVQGSRICYKCTGIQCSRTTYNQTKMCEDSLAVCVTIFENFNVVERGCSEEISPNLMNKCLATEFDDDENDEYTENTDCLKCNENYCNVKGRKEFQCIQCDSKVNPDCKENPNKIMATSCPISTSPNSYCFIEHRNDQTIRGCSGNLKHQRDCLSNNDCMLCLAGDMANCNVAKFKSNTGGSNNTTPIPPNNNTTQASNVTTPIPPNNNTTQTSNNTTPIPPNSNSTQAPNVTTPKPTNKPGSAVSINCTISILIISVIINFIS